MNRLKRIYCLLGVLAAVCIATFTVTRYEEKQEQIKNTDTIILKVAPDSVTALSWEYGSDSLAFHKDEAWLWDEDEAFPVDQEKIGDMLAQFEAFGAAFIIEEVEDYGQYGLEEPECTVHLTAGEQDYAITLGDFSTLDQQRYVSIGDGNVYLVKEDPSESFNVGIEDMIDHDETPRFDDVTSIQFSGAESHDIFIAEDSVDTYCPTDIYFLRSGNENLPLDTSRVESYLTAIDDLSLTNYVSYNATEEELAQYGLDDPELTVTVAYTVEDDEGNEVEETYVLHISRDPEELAKLAEAEEEEEENEEEITAYARVGESRILYQIPGVNYTELMTVSYNDLRHLEVFTGEFSGITQLDITLEGETYTIASADDEEGVRTWYYSEEALSTSKLKSALENLKAAEFTEEKPSQKEEIRLILWLDNENHPQVEIQLYRYDGEHCLAVLDGEPFALVGRSQVVDLIEAVNAIVL